VSRLKKQWEDEHTEWRQRDLTNRRYVYWWADGIYSNVRMDDRLCLLVIIGVTEHGRKELVAVEDGFRESAASWETLLTGLRERGLTTAPKLAVGGGAMGFWAALSKIYPETDHQRCWVHKSANVLNKLPKSVQPKVKADLHEIWMAETRETAHRAFDRTLKRFEAKYPRAMACLAKDRDELLAFYDYPAEHWVHIRTTNPIEYRVDHRHGPPEDQAEPELRLPGDDPGDGLQAAPERSEALEAHQALPEAGTGRQQRQVSRMESR